MKATAIGMWDDVAEDRYGDEYRTFHVGLIDDDGKPVGKVYNCSNERTALMLLQRMSKDRHLPTESYL